MNMERYTVNITNDIRFVYSTTIAIKTLKGRFQLKGNNISEAAHNESSIRLVTDRQMVGNLHRQITICPLGSPLLISKDCAIPFPD